MEYATVPGGCFAVRDYRGQRIKLVRGDDGSFEVLTTDEWDNGALVLYRLPHRSPHFHIPIPTHPAFPSCTPIFEARSDKEVAIRHPLSDTYFSSEGVSGPSQSLPANRLSVSSWEVFQLLDIESDGTYDAATARLEHFERSTNKASIIISALQALDLDLLKGVAIAHHAIDDCVYDVVAAYLVRNPRALQNSASAFKDPYLDHALLPLLDALADAATEWRRAPPTLEINAEYDFLNQSSWGTRIASFWHGVNAALRRGIQPSRGLCIVATIRNEGIYILEWIAYHLRQGVSHFFIYTNDNIDGSELLLSALSQTDYVTVITNNFVPIGASAQNKSYGHALTALLPILDFAWCGIIDVDEFVMPGDRQQQTFPQMLFAMSEYVDAVILCWVTVGSQLHPPVISQPLTQRCQRVFQDEERVVKSFLRPQRFIHASPHVGAGGGDRPRYLVDSHEHLFECVRPDEVPDPRIYRAIASRFHPAPFVLYHYYFKSALEFVWKSARNRGDHPKTVDIAMASAETARDFLQQMEKTSTRSRAVEDAEELGRRLDDLLRITAIADAYRVVRETFATRCAMIVDHGIRTSQTQPQEVQALLTLASTYTSLK